MQDASDGRIIRAQKISFENSTDIETKSNQYSQN